MSISLIYIKNFCTLYISYHKSQKTWDISLSTMASNCIHVVAKDRIMWLLLFFLLHPLDSNFPGEHYLRPSICICTFIITLTSWNWNKQTAVGGKSNTTEAFGCTSLILVPGVTLLPWGNTPTLGQYSYPGVILLAQRTCTLVDGNLNYV